MAHPQIQTNFRLRKNLGRVERVIDVPNLVDIQKSSYDKFLQMNVPPNEREDVGLQGVFLHVKKELSFLRLQLIF